MLCSQAANSGMMFQSSPGGTFSALSFHTRPFWQPSKPILDMSKTQDTITSWILRMKDLFKPSLCALGLKKRHGWTLIWMNQPLKESLPLSCPMRVHGVLHPYSWCPVNSQDSPLGWCRISYPSINTLWNTNIN